MLLYTTSDQSTAAGSAVELRARTWAYSKPLTFVFSAVRMDIEYSTSNPFRAAMQLVTLSYNLHC
eukprot:IDg13071t1